MRSSSCWRPGVHDAWSTPIMMKKGRPAVTLSALAPEMSTIGLLDVLYNETTTLGVRIHTVDEGRAGETVDRGRGRGTSVAGQARHARGRRGHPEPPNTRTR